MKFSLEKINKNLLLIALASLIYRSSSFSLSHIPNPFEIIFSLVAVLTLIYLIKDHKIKEFFHSIPKNILVAVSCLTFSILLGWLISVFIKSQPTSFNSVIEIAIFFISLCTFSFILFYTKDDTTYANRYFYALLFPVVYIIFILLPQLAYYFHIMDGDSFIGLTTNRNIVSKIILIPAIFFIVKALFRYKNIWLNIVYILFSSALTSLLFWTNQRGVLVGLVFGIIFILAISYYYHRDLKRTILNFIIILIILTLGFIITPYMGKKITAIRVSDTKMEYLQIKNKFISNTSSNDINVVTTPVSRFEIWTVYLKQIIKNPLGVGPNTHIKTKYAPGEYTVLGPHNSYIQVCLWGGILGLLSFLYLIFSAFKNLILKLKSDFNPITVSLVGILFSLSIAIIFNDSLELFIFWIILALSLRK